MMRTCTVLVAALTVFGATEALAKFNPKRLVSSPGAPELSLTSRASVNQYEGYLAAAAPRFQSAALTPALGGRVVAQADTAAGSMSRAELEAEFTQLEDNNPSLVGPIILIVAGVVVEIIGAIVHAAITGAVISGAVTAASAPYIIATLIYIVGAVMVVGGAAWLGWRIWQKVKRSQRMDAIQEQLKSMGTPAPSTVQRFDMDRPGTRGYEPQLVMATF
jgi:hypothetical protein